MSENDNALNQSEELESDYDKEWGLDDTVVDTSPPANGTDSHTTELQESTDEGTAPSDVAPDGLQSASQEGTPSTAAEPEQDDPFAGWSEEQLAVYRKTERDAKANAGRNRVAQDRISRLETQLREKEEQRLALVASTREPTGFEQAHPEYAEDLKQIFSQNAAPGTAEIDTQIAQENAQQEAADAIINAHPDAGEIYNRPDFQEWLNLRPDYRQDIESPNADDVIKVLDVYTTIQAHSQPTARSSNPLDGMASVGGSSAQPDLRLSSELSTAEQYEREWDTDTY